MFSNVLRVRRSASSRLVSTRWLYGWLQRTAIHGKRPDVSQREFARLKVSFDRSPRQGDSRPLDPSDGEALPDVPPGLTVAAAERMDRVVGANSRRASRTWPLVP